MEDFNEDIDSLFQEVIEPSEMQPSQQVWNSIDQKLDKTAYNSLQKKYKGVFNFSIGVSVVVISLVFLILNQNQKKKRGVVENTIENNQPIASTQPITSAIVEPENTKPTTTENFETNAKGVSATNESISNQVSKDNITTLNSNNNKSFSKTENSSLNSSTTIASTAISMAANTINNSLPNNVAQSKTTSTNNTASASLNVLVENSNSTNEVVLEKNNDAAKPSIDNTSGTSNNAELNNSENKSVSENEKPISSPENVEVRNSINNQVVEVATKSVTEDKNETQKPSNSFDNSILNPSTASSTENNLNQTTSSSNTEASLTSTPIAKNEELLNSSLSSTTLVKQEEVKNNSTENTTAATTKNVSDTAATANGDIANNPLNGLIPLKEFKCFAGAFYSPDKVMTNLIDVNNNANTLDEKTNISPSIGIVLGYQFNKHWSLATNVVYSSVSTTFNFNKTISSNDEDSEEGEDEDHHTTITNYKLNSTYGVIDLPVTHTLAHTGVAPIPDHRYDTAIVNVSGVSKFKYISVPIECQYTMGKDRLTFFVSMGISTNFLISNKTDISDEISNIHYDATVEGLKKVYFNASLGAGVQYRIWQRLSVFIEPKFRQSITSINTNVPIKTYPSLLGISGGLLFHF